MPSILAHPPSPPRLALKRRQSANAGFSIVEVVVAATLIVIGLGGLLQLSVRSLRLLKTQSETALAAQAFQERVDYLRGLPYGYLTNSVNYTGYTYQMTDAETGVTTPQTTQGLLKNLTGSVAALKSPVETVKIVALPVSEGSAPAIIIRIADGAVTVTPAAGSDLSGEKMVRVDFRVDWVETATGRARVQEASFVVARNGVGK